MFLLARPTPADIDRFLSDAHRSVFTYADIGATETKIPPGYVMDHNRIEFGRNCEWETAKRAITDWKMFDFGWVALCSSTTPIEPGQTVAILISHFGFYSLNAARIVYTIDEPSRFGFAYGTLADHGESGEERFLVTRDPETGRVWYELKAFSRPNHIMAKLGYPLVRSLQKRFAKDSMAAMLRAVRDNRLN